MTRMNDVRRTIRNCVCSCCLTVQMGWGQILEEAMWQRCRAEHEDKLARIAKLPTELARRDEQILLEFDTFDLDGSGTIDVAEFEFLLRELAIFLEPDEVGAAAPLPIPLFGSRMDSVSVSQQYHCFISVTG